MRSSFALAAASAALLMSVTVSAEARPRRVAAAVAPVAVDVSRLRELGLGATADLIQATVAHELAALGGQGRVSVRVTGLSMNNYAGSDSGSGGGASGSSGSSGSNNDYLEGDVFVIGPGGQILSQKHQVVATPASSGGAYYLPGAEQRRVESVSRVFAAWATRTAF